MRVFVLIVAAGLAGCNSPAAVSHAASNADAKGSERVERSPGKPEHPLQVRLVTPKRLSAGAEGEAELLVSSAYQMIAMEVTLRPSSGMMVSQERFERRDGALRSGGVVQLPFRLTPAVNEPQQLTVIIRGTLPDGRVMSREVTLNVGGNDKATAPRTKGGQRLPDDASRPGEDVVVPAEQDIVRDDG